MGKESSSGVVSATPGWLPVEVRRYLAHVERGQSMREIARDVGCHASTILRQIRRTEARRDDILVDRALSRLGRVPRLNNDHLVHGDRYKMTMTATMKRPDALPDEAQLREQAPVFLRRLNETGVTFAIAKEMEMGLIVRNGPDGNPIRLAQMSSALAEAFALKDWIAPISEGRITRYRITQAGRMALKRFTAEDEVARAGAEAQPFAAQHGDMREKEVGEEPRRRRVRYNAAESPLLVLARRIDKDGKPFLEAPLVAAGERLREDFELAQMGPRVTQNWDRFLTAGARGDFNMEGGGGSEAARKRLTNALSDLGPGLGDVVLRCCCFLEGMEAVEKHMGWSARSGKIVLRIALTRLASHYEATGTGSPMIG